jgi:iron complex outermembrane receptor protein
MGPESRKTRAGRAWMMLLLAPAAAAEEPMEEILVVDRFDARTYELAETLDVAPDSASLLERAVGADVVTNGPLTGMAQYRGMSRMRVSSRINGQVISPGGPNWMDAPLSYAPAAHLETLEVHRGIAPVHAGAETIGGVIDATSWHGRFADAGTDLQGRVRAGSHSVNSASLVSASLVGATTGQRVQLAFIDERGDDARFPGGSVLPTEYERRRYDVGYGFRFGDHTVQLDYGRNETGDAGTPALPMDIQWIDSDLLGLTHRYDGEALQVETRVYYSSIDHGMTNYHLRTAPMSPSMYRRNVTDVENLGFGVTAALGRWRFGVDGHDEVHGSDIDNPNAAAFFVRNFEDAQRTLLSAFLERDVELRRNWTAELGVRASRIETDAGTVDGTPAVLGMAPAVALRDRFNGADRSRTDHTVDWVGRVRWSPSSDLSWTAAVARKSRAPAYQERYLWLPLQATAGLADGRTYTGNLDLEPEVAHEFEVGFDYDDGRLHAAPRLFLRDVTDYIQGTPSTNAAAVQFVRMMNMMNGTANADPLEFSNVDARFSGFDMDWRYRFDARWSAEGVVNYVRGERRDVDDDLYRVPPLNAHVAVRYDRDRWGVRVETSFHDDQDRVSSVNAEPVTYGYVLGNLRAWWQVSERLRVSAGVDNVADVRYADHLAGLNRVRGNPGLPTGARLPGYGRNAFARLDLEL